MSDKEPPVATKAAIPRTSQACQRCRSLKTRCLPSSQPGTCQRCFAVGRECAWAEAPRRARKLRAPSRISQVEQKIDGLVASLTNPPEVQSTTDPKSASAPAPVGWVNAPTLGGDFAPLADGGRRPPIPGNWLPFPSSFEQRLEPPESPVEQAEAVDGADRQYIEQIRSIHSFDGPGEYSKQQGSLFRPSKRREEPIEDEYVEGLLVSGEADILLCEYRKMSESFPFVPLASDVTAQQLYCDAPMLFLAMITAASWKEHKRQMSLDAIYRQELANRTILRPRRNLVLVKSVLVYLSWYHFVFSHKTQQIFFLHHLVIGLALDIGLHRDFQPLVFVHTRKPQDVDPKEKRERQRSFLGCYYLASMVSAALQKPNLLKHNSDMTEWAQELKRDGEFASDQAIEHLISLRHIEDQIQDTLFTGAAANAQFADACVMVHMGYLGTQLDVWKRHIEGIAHQRVLVLSHAYAEMILYSVALRPLGEPAPTTDGTHLKALVSTLEAAKRFFETLLSFPASDYHLISFSEWMRLPSVMMTVAKLCIPSHAHDIAGWDVKTAQDQVRLEIILEALCYRFQNHTTYDKITQPHFDFWCAMRLVTDLTRTWYLRKINPQTQTSASTQLTPSNSSGGNLLGSNSGALNTPQHGCGHPQYTHLADADFNNMSSSFGVEEDGTNDPFAFMKSADFDLEQMFEMGIWGDEAYHGMGFGGGGGMYF